MPKSPRPSWGVDAAQAHSRETPVAVNDGAYGPEFPGRRGVHGVRERARPGRRPRPEPLPSRPIGRTGRARGPRGRRRAPPGAAPAPTSCSRGRGSPDAPRCPARAHPAPSRVPELRPPLGSRVAAGVSTITPRRPRNLVAPEAAAARPLPRSDSGRLQGPAARRAFFLGNFSLVCGAG